MRGIKMIFVGTKRNNTFGKRAQVLVETSLGIKFHCFLSVDPLFNDTTFCGIYLSILFSI